MLQNLVLARSRPLYFPPKAFCKREAAPIFCQRRYAGPKISMHEQICTRFPTPFHEHPANQQIWKSNRSEEDNQYTCPPLQHFPATTPTPRSRRSSPAFPRTCAQSFGLDNVRVFCLRLVSVVAVFLHERRLDNSLVRLGRVAHELHLHRTCLLPWTNGLKTTIEGLGWAERAQTGGGQERERERERERTSLPQSESAGEREDHCHKERRSERARVRAIRKMGGQREATRCLIKKLKLLNTTKWFVSLNATRWIISSEEVPHSTRTLHALYT